MKNLINRIYHNKIAEALLHTVVYELKKELAGCESALDLGCGPDSPIQHCKNIEHSVGVEAYISYLDRSKNKKIHNEYINQDIRTVNFEPNSFDAVIMIEVLEHLTKEDGIKMLERAEQWARKKVIITTPNGFINQKPLDGNSLQKHLSGWISQDFKNRRYRVRGLAGPKFLRKEAEHESMNDNITATIKRRPKILWFGVSALSQILYYYLPSHAFELIAIKKGKDGRIT